METLLIEVHCLLRADDVRWEKMDSLLLEIGYPGRNGQTHWKHTGWVREQHPGLAKSFAHTLWKRETSAAVLVVEFSPQYQPESGALEKSYRFRTHFTGIDGKTHTQKIQIAEGPFTNPFLSFITQYPKGNT